MTNEFDLMRAQAEHLVEIECPGCNDLVFIVPFSGSYDLCPFCGCSIDTAELLDDAEHTEEVATT